VYLKNKTFLVLEGWHFMISQITED
jgi:hypothetical protein